MSSNCYLWLYMEKMARMTAVFGLLLAPVLAMGQANLYLGYSSSYLTQQPQPFFHVKQELSLSGSDDAVKMGSFTRGVFIGIRGISDNEDIPIGVEYVRQVRKVGTNEVYFDALGELATYRMKSNLHQVGFIYGTTESKVLIGLNYEFGSLKLKMKRAAKEEFDKANYKMYVETVDFLPFPHWGALYHGLNLYVIYKIGKFEIRPMLHYPVAKIIYHDYTNYIDFQIEMTSLSLAVYWAPSLGE